MHQIQKWFFLAFLILPVIGGLGCKTSTSFNLIPATPSDQRAILWELFAFGEKKGFREEYQKTWQPNNPVCKWYGVTCNQDGTVRELIFTGNPLEILPESFGNLSTLEKVDLSANHFTTLPDSVGKLTRLKYVNLSDNQLAMLPETFRNLTELQQLLLSNNHFKNFPDFLVELKKLQLFVVAGLSDLVWVVPPSLCSVVRPSVDSPHISFELCPHSGK